MKLLAKLKAAADEATTKACNALAKACGADAKADALQDKLDAQTRLVYRLTPPAATGLNYRFWLAAAGPHLDPLKWSGPADPVSGFALPTAAAADSAGISSASNITDTGAGGITARYGIIDGWIFLPDGTTTLRDNNGNTGEYGMVLTGDCCGGALVEQAGGNHTVNTSGGDRTLMDAVPISGGWHYIYNPQSDSGAAQGLDLEYSTDGGTSWQEVTVMQPTKPTVESQEIGFCDPIPAGWQLAPIEECCQPEWQAAGGIDEAAVLALIPEQVICTGPFTQQGSRTSWWAGWTPVETGNLAAVTSPWYNMGVTRTSPACVTDVSVAVDPGNHYFLLRRTRVYLWLHFRLLINGAQVDIETFDKYIYRDERNDTNPDVIPPLRTETHPAGFVNLHRLSVPAGSTMQVQAQTRWQVTGAQSSAYARYIGGLRSEPSFTTLPPQIVIGRS